MPVPNERFRELLGDIEPSQTTVHRGSAAHTGVREHLRTQSQFRNRYISSFLAGSYARDTAIRPRTLAGNQDRPDVDIVVVTNFTRRDHPDAVLREVARALRDGGRGYEVERINKRSVRVETSQAEMDIVPVIESGYGFGYEISDREMGLWLFTNPPFHTDWSSQQNVRFGGDFKPLVKMFKWWRRTNLTGSPRPKGFVLEVLVAMFGPPAVTHYGEAFARTLEGIYNAYAYDASMNRKPVIADPAVPTNDILAKVTVPQWKAFIEKVRVHAGIARHAQVTDDMEEATHRWRRIFGDRFRPTARPASAARYGGLASAAVTSGYTFPDASAAPPSKPRGFA